MGERQHPLFHPQKHLELLFLKYYFEKYQKTKFNVKKC
jgi:hypothetical protein